MSVGKGSINRALKTGVSSSKKAETLSTSEEKKVKQTIGKAVEKKSTPKKQATKKVATKQSAAKKPATKSVENKKPDELLSVKIYEVGQELPIYLL